jgi:hypothetical protein
MLLDAPVNVAVLFTGTVGTLGVIPITQWGYENRVYDCTGTQLLQ